MNYECCYDPANDHWVACNVIDSTTSITHKYVRVEGPHGAFHTWFLNERVRVADPKKNF
jgi:hypothetical protein